MQFLNDELIQIPTFLHVSKALFKLMIYFWSKGKVIHKNNTGRERERQQWFVHMKLLSTQKCNWILQIEAFSRCLVCRVTLCLLSSPSILQTESRLSPAENDDGKQVYVFILEKPSATRTSTLTVYSPCFFPYHFIHFLNSLSMVCQKKNVNIQLIPSTFHPWTHQDAKALTISDASVAI